MAPNPIKSILPKPPEVSILTSAKPLPENIRAIVAKNINAAAVNERADVAKLNANLQQELAGKGLIFNQPAVAPFREKLRSAGFYAEWKGKYGDQAWDLLEQSVGKLI